MTNPKYQDLADHAMSRFHLVSSLTFLKTTKTSKKHTSSHFPQIHTNKNFSPHFTLFSLKERARSSLMSVLSNPRVHTLKERQNSISYLLHTLSRKPKTQEAISLFHTHGPTPEERKDSLKLSASHTWVQPLGKGNLFMQE